VGLGTGGHGGGVQSGIRRRGNVAADIPRGSRNAIWFISEVSDASMAFPFVDSPAPSILPVIITRLDQNDHLKPFVCKVMLFDVILQPVGIS
jgi:hypothetical protein